MALKVVAFGVCQQTIALLAKLLRMAARGQIRGVAICYWVHGAGNCVELSGLFDAEPERALGASDLIKVYVCQQLELFL